MNLIYHRSKVLFAVCVLLLMTGGKIFPQQATTPTAAAKSAEEKARQQTQPPVTATRVIVSPRPQTNTPQVVTVVHQLSAMKVLRLLLRQPGEKDIVAMMNGPLATRNDVHTNIIAGLALDDGKTIAVWLPQATVEIDGLLRQSSLSSQFPDPFNQAAATAANLSIVLSDGKRVRVSYVGLDVTTGVSVLQGNLAGVMAGKPKPEEKLFEGQRMHLVAPQRVPAPTADAPATIYVRVGESDGRLDQITRTSAGQLERFTVTAPDLSPAFVGGIAVDDSGVTTGIVEEVDGIRARVLPASLIDAAVRRVLKQQASVPRPLLGVRGDPAAFAPRGSFLSFGWNEQDLGSFFQKPTGILLTSVLPGTPAANAKLRPGDVIMRVNEDEVKTEEDFTWFLGEAGSGSDVRFTIARPGQLTPESIQVKLGGSLEPVSSKFELGNLPGADASMLRLGMETVALSGKAASTEGILGGLLVVAVERGSAASQGGVREGDLIEMIDGRPAVRALGIPFFIGPGKKHSFSLVREHQRIQIVLETPLEK
jgi:S1-C subfamily serine protease